MNIECDLAAIFPFHLLALPRNSSAASFSIHRAEERREHRREGNFALGECAARRVGRNSDSRKQKVLCRVVLVG